MGFYTSVFEAAQRDIDAARLKVFRLEKEIKELAPWRLIRWAVLSSRLEAARKAVDKAEWDYQRLWD